MTVDPSAPRTRRAVLAAAAAGAAALAVNAAVRPSPTTAADPDDLVLNQDNATTAATSVTQGTADTGAFAATGNGSGTGLTGQSSTGAGVKGQTLNPDRSGVFGLLGADESEVVTSDWNSGVYGFANVDGNSAGVWGDTFDGAGVIGTGQWGVVGIGWPGILGITSAGTGVHGHGGSAPVPVQPAKTGVLASSPDGVALDVRGKVKFSRSGRSSIAKGRSALTVSLAGVTTSSLVFAVLYSNRSGRYVRAVTPTTGRFTIYLNSTVTAASYISWFVVN